MARTEAVINSMTMKERRNPDLINGSRRQRIAAGSGTTVAQVNQVLRQFTQMRQMMQQVMNPKAKGGRPKMPPLPKGMGGMGGMPGMGGLPRYGRPLRDGWCCPGIGGLPGMGGMPGLPGAPGSGKSATKKKKTERQKRKKKRESSSVCGPRRRPVGYSPAERLVASFPAQSCRSQGIPLVLEQQLYTIPIGVFQCPLN